MAQLSMNLKLAEGCSPPKRLKIKIPTIDNSDLLARSSNVLMGMCLNPSVQNVDTFIFRMPQFWEMVGRVKGLNLGNGRFQFEFQDRADMEDVLSYGSIHFDKWMVTFAPWKAMADVDYPNTIQLWTRITGIPFEYRVEEIYKVVAGAIGVLVKIDVARGQVLIELPCSKPLIFSSVLEFQEGLETKVMFEYIRLSGFCPLCYRMTHNAELCYKAKKEVTSLGVSDKQKSTNGARNQSYRGALLSGAHNGTSYVKPKGLQGPLVGVKKPRGLFQSRVKRGALKGAGIESGAETSSSVKKVRRPLFPKASSQEPVVDVKGDVGEVPAAEPAELSLKPVELFTGGRDLSHVDGQVSLPASDCCNADEGEMQLTKSSSQMDENKLIDALAQQAAALKAQGLSDEEMEKIHVDYAKKLARGKFVSSAILPPPPNKVASRSSTPLRGVSFKKLMSSASMSPKLMPKKMVVKGDKLKE